MRVLTRAAAAALATTSVLAALTLPAAPALADSVRDDSWHVKALELAELHKITQGEGVTVAVVDSGVDPTHPDLRGNVLPGVDLYDDDAKGRVDRIGHGTGVASLIAGHGHGTGGRDGILGVAPKAKILPVTIKKEGNAPIAPTALAAGISWAVDAGADVINVSLSSSFNDELNQAVERAYQSNVVVVASAGNDDDILVGNPAAHPGCIGVNGVDRKGVISKAASVPGTLDLRVDIAAPGQDMVVAVPGGRYRTTTGSSTSSAVVSGAMALIKAEYPDLSAYQLFLRLMETAEDAGEPGHDEYYGWGALDLREALTGEPDGRASRTASTGRPEVDDPLAAARAAGSDGPDIEEIVIVVLVWAVILGILAGIVIAIVRLRRRSRRRRAGAIAPENALATSGAPGPPAPDAPSEQLPASTPTDDGVWRRPSG
ncbi:type VII secretion-associated serine protease mycosin [Micromonospora phaseoli]|uniref:Type VII secretion-associated serine protease mycosin n=1 Tax=Micromonospora phaseoli TaxID=1144548 RepID=A0A1H7DTE1_9ACTN|nr:S8 family serine peptidase [Micromonospora phaseoli]PZV99216.1 type VII secretion-associated serine protease mycosin [Micromonospora phaseoli]GIJ79988.1 type VII secretion-associated serine protease [Micromonospora phaseoli]SEK05006.1 type VII secretion-associated serine protease mycosin [Micromonospora phaseoli]